MDKWTFEGGDDDHYKSSEASYVASTIRAIGNEEASFPGIPKRSDVEQNARVRLNLRHMSSWLTEVEKAHVQGDNGENEDLNYPHAKKIIASIQEEDVWDYERPALKKCLTEISDDEITGDDSILCSLVQLFAFHHYLTAPVLFFCHRTLYRRVGI